MQSYFAHVCPPSFWPHSKDVGVGNEDEAGETERGGVCLSELRSFVSPQMGMELVFGRSSVSLERLVRGLVSIRVRIVLICTVKEVAII